MSSGVDADKVLRLALCHDLAESRTSDLNYVHQKYVTVSQERASAEQAEGLPFGRELLELDREYREERSPEALLAHDADQLEMLLSLKEELDGGAAQAEHWIPFVRDRLHSDLAREIAGRILERNSSDWWFDRESDWWVRGSKERKPPAEEREE